MVYEQIPIRPRKNLAPRFPTYYPKDNNNNSRNANNTTLSPKFAILIIRTGVYFLLLFSSILFLYCIPIRPERIISRLTSSSNRLASDLPPPSQLPTIHYLLPPSDLIKNLAQCSTICQGQEWHEEIYSNSPSGTQDLSKSVEEAFGQKVNYEESYPKDWPFLVRNTDQFALNSIISLRMNHLSQSQNSSLTTLTSADFIYIALDTRHLARCFGGCRGLPSILETGLDRKAFKIEIVDWLLETIVSLRHRRQYPSLILSLALIDHDYEYNILSEKSQDVVRDDLIVLGIERCPWTTKDSLKWFEQIPYPSTLHLPVYDSIEAEKEGRNKLVEWTQSREKTFLLSFAGRSHPILNNSGKGVLNGFSIRTLLANQLALSTASDLHIHYFTPSSPRTSNSLALIHKAMSNSKFCLQPPGDSPTRRGVYESILIGCIPVLFRKGGYTTWSESTTSGEQGKGKGIGGRELGGLNIERDLAIFIDEEIMLENESLGIDSEEDGNDIVSSLRNWDLKEVERIQGNMMKVAGIMQYSMPRDGEEDWLMRGSEEGEGGWSEDAFGMLLRRLTGVKEGRTHGW